MTPHRHSAYGRPLLLVLAAGLVFAAPPATLAQPAPAPAARPAAAPDADAIIARAAAAYAGMRSYSDTLDMIQSVELEEEGAEMTPEPMSVAFRFGAPRSFAVVSEREGGFYSDGERMWVHSHSNEEYVDVEAPEEVNLRRLTSEFPVFFIPPHPVAEVLLRSDPAKPAHLFPWLKSVASAKPMALGGQAGVLVTGEADLSELMYQEATVPVSLWFSDATGLLGEVRFNLTDLMRKMNEATADGGGEDDDGEAIAVAMPEFKSFEWVLTLGSVRANPELAQGDFIFRPTEGTAKVDELTSPWELGGSELAELVGSPAPAFSATTLDGKPLDLADLRGKVVLIDFWATWCGPCVQAIPHIQEISERFADKPLVVLGISRDQPGTEKRIAAFLEKRGITFPQVLDASGEIAGKYSVTGIPCTYLIDAKGVVQDVSVGFVAGQGERLAEKIERLLAGESLVEAGATAKAERPRGERVRPGIAIADVNPGAITGGAVHGAAGVNAFWARQIDVDGDGTAETVAPDQQGGLLIISADGAAAERIKLAAGANSHINGFALVRGRGGDGPGWLVARTSWSPYGGTSSSNVALHSAAGTVLWTYAPEVPDGVNCQFAVAATDLTGDGAEEMVVVVTTYRLKREGENSYSQEDAEAYLAILDAAGTVLSQRRIGRTAQILNTIPAASGSPGAVLIDADARLRRFTLGDVAAGAPAEGE